jgi:hypothetical protein
MRGVGPCATGCARSLAAVALARCGAIHIVYIYMVMEKNRPTSLVDR